MNLAEREYHQPLVRDVADLLDRVILEGNGFDPRGHKAAQLAEYTLKVAPSTLSMYRAGTRPLPAFMVPLIDAGLGGHRMAQGMAEFCRLGVYELEDRPSDEDLETLHELIQRTHGNADAELTKALRDHVIQEDERIIIHPLAAKMHRFWQDIEERTRPAAAQRSA